MKEEQFRKAKEHLYYLDNVLQQNKKERKKQRGHLIHNKYESVGLGSVTTTSYSVGFAAILLFIAKLPLGLAIAAGCLGGFVCSFVIPRIIHFSILKFAQGKLGRGYAKMEQDYQFQVMKWLYKKNHKNLYNAKDSSQVSENELKSFAYQAGIFAQNAKYEIDKNIFNRIAKRNDKDFKKITQLYNTEQDRRTLEKKVQRIIKKNRKYTLPWCKLYNECGTKARELYLQASAMDSNLKMLPDYEFRVKEDAVVDMVAKYIDPSLVVREQKFNANCLTNNMSNSAKTNYNSNMQSKDYDKDMEF